MLGRPRPCAGTVHITFRHYIAFNPGSCRAWPCSLMGHYELLMCPTPLVHGSLIAGLPHSTSPPAAPSCSTLLALHRTAVLRHDAIGQETLMNLLLRNYLHYNLYDQVGPLQRGAARAVPPGLVKDGHMGFGRSGPVSQVHGVG